MGLFNVFDRQNNHNHNHNHNRHNHKMSPQEMATAAMSDEMTIGLEQIIVSLTLMVVSLCVLSRQKPHQQWLPGLFTREQFNVWFLRLTRNIRRKGGAIVRAHSRSYTESVSGSRVSVGADSTSSFNNSILGSNANVNANTNANTKKKPRRLSFLLGPDANIENATTSEQDESKQNTLPHCEQQKQEHHTEDSEGIESSGDNLGRSRGSTATTSSNAPMKGKLQFNTSTLPTAVVAATSTTKQNQQQRPYSPIRKSQSSPMVSCIPTSIVTNTYNNSNNNNNKNNNTNTPEEYTTLTDHEQFTTIYETHLRHSSYRRLILPTACRLLDTTVNTTRNRNEGGSPRKSTSSSLAHSIRRRITRQQKRQGMNVMGGLEEEGGEGFDDDDDDIIMDDLDSIDGDNPRRDRDEEDKQGIWNIISYGIDVIHKIVSFDYIGHMIHFNLRIIYALICRYKRILLAWGFNVKLVEDEEDEEDDLTVGSLSSKRSFLSRESGHGNVGGGGLGGSSHVVSGSNGRGSPMPPRQNSDNRSVISNVTVEGLATPYSSLPPMHLTNNCIPTSASSDGEKTSRERFYTGEIYSNFPKPTAASSTSTNNNIVAKEELCQPSSLKIEGRRSSDVSHSESIVSLSGFSESWEYEQQRQQSQNSDALTIPPTNLLLQEEEKKDCSTLDGDSFHSNVGIMPSLTDLSNVPNLPGVENELPSISADFSVDLEGHDDAESGKKLQLTPKNKNNQIGNQSSGGRLPILPRQGNKRKDALESYRNPAASSSILTFLPPSQKNVVAEDRTVSTSPERNSARELSYFDSVQNRSTIQKLELATPLPDREGYILGDQFLEDPKDTPLLVFVNSRSGSQQGLMLKMQLKSLLNPIQIWDLADGEPEKILKSFMVFSRLRLLVCGGDGTVSWIISTLDKMNVERWPPIAILPLGTGNDLARIHGWGGGYANESLLLILKQVQEAYISLLDRWTMKIERKKKKKSGEKKDEVKPFTNYMSIGMDALSALQVHNLRENSPDMFFSRAINKLWYGLYGAEDAIKASCSDLPQQVRLEADGIEIPIPDDCQGLIILNIDSYLGGVPLWSRGVPYYNSENGPKTRRRGRRYSDGDSYMNFDSGTTMKRTGSYDSIIGEETESGAKKLDSLIACDSPSSCQDGRLDVISIRGNFHLGQIRVGLANAQCLCQCSKVKIELKKSAAVQIDGEPWKQDKSILTIEREKDPAIMLHRAIEGGNGIETEVADLLEWAEENKIIKRDVHATLMKEFSRRIETKTRARRDRNEVTVFSAMKRGIASRNKLSHLG